MDWMEVIQKAAQSDAWYQRALDNVRKLEPEYLKILQSLLQVQREILEAYVTACEAMDDALLQIAWRERSTNGLEE